MASLVIGSVDWQLETSLDVNIVGVPNQVEDEQSVYQSAGLMVSLSEICPFVLDEIVDVFVVEDFEFVGLADKLNKRDVRFLKFELLLLGVVFEVLSETRDQRDAVSYFVNFAGVNHVVVQFSQSVPKLWLWEYFVILRTQIEDGEVVRAHALASFLVSLRPFIEIEFVQENLGLQQRIELNSFLNDEVQILQKEKVADVTVLVFHKIVDDCSNCSGLVVLNGNVDGVSVAVFIFLVAPLDVFIFVENRILLTKQGRIAVVKQKGKTHGVETHDCAHVGSIELEKALVENERLWLILNDFPYF
jgi:hypothetical protein